MNRKKKFGLAAAAFALLAALYGLTYIPQHVVRLNPDQIDEILVFNGYIGRQVKITDQAEIRQTVEQLNGVTFQKGKSSLGYMGFGLRLEFRDQAGKKINALIINREYLLRYRGFFYTAVKGKMPYDELLHKFDKPLQAPQAP